MKPCKLLFVQNFISVSGGFCGILGCGVLLGQGLENVQYVRNVK